MAVSLTAILSVPETVVGIEIILKKQYNTEGEKQ